MQQRFEGVASVVDQDLPIIRTDLTPSGAYAAVSAFLRDGARARSAFVVGTYGQTAATIRAVADAGLRIPDDIRVVGFDGSAADYGRLRLTTVQQPVDALAHEALGRLLGDSPLPDDGFAPTLKVGETCGCA